MFSKIFILFAVGLTLANSQEETRTNALIPGRTRSILGTLGSWLHKATDMVTYPYRKAFDILVQTGQGFADYGSEKILQLTNKYHDIKNKYQQNLDNIKNDIIKRALGELQHVVNILGEKANVTTCNEIKQSNKDLIEESKQALDQLEQDLQEAVDAELQNLQNELENWKIEADDAVKKAKSRRKYWF